MDNIKLWITGAVGAVGAAISTAFGGWTSAMTTLIIFMAIDYITGIMVAGIFKRSSSFVFVRSSFQGAAFWIMISKIERSRLHG